MFKPFFTVLHVEAGVGEVTEELGLAGEFFADGRACAWSEGDGGSGEGEEGAEAYICE